MDRVVLGRSKDNNRQHFIGGSDARIIMGSDEAALHRLWREKRGEAEPEDLSGNLIVQLGCVTEDLNRHWCERNTGQVVTDVQKRHSGNEIVAGVNQVKPSCQICLTASSIMRAVRHRSGHCEEGPLRGRRRGQTPPTE